MQQLPRKSCMVLLLVGWLSGEQVAESVALCGMMQRESHIFTFFMDLKFRYKISDNCCLYARYAYRGHEFYGQAGVDSFHTLSQGLFHE